MYINVFTNQLKFKNKVLALTETSGLLFGETRDPININMSCRLMNCFIDRSVLQIFVLKLGGSELELRIFNYKLESCKLLHLVTLNLALFIEQFF